MTAAIIGLLVLQASFLTAFIGIIGLTMAFRLEGRAARAIRRAAGQKSLLVYSLRSHHNQPTKKSII